MEKEEGRRKEGEGQKDFNYYYYTERKGPVKELLPFSFLPPSFLLLQSLFLLLTPRLL